MKKIENEAIKHLVFACVASNDAKKGKQEKTRYFSKRIIREYSKEKHIYSKYARKEKEICNAIKIVDKIKNPNLASYNITVGKDQGGKRCYLVNFKIKYNDENVQFGFHMPKYTNIMSYGRNNYPKIEKETASNSDALHTVLKSNEIFEGGLSALELYA